MSGRTEAPPVVVLDDDPTGTQELGGVRVLLAWDAESIAAALDGHRAVHLITNVRALSASQARTVTRDAAHLAHSASPRARIILRGDSTLRGHLLEELEGVAEIVTPGRIPPVLLVPALPSAGRVTLDGIQLIERAGQRIPLHETEYSHDGIFSYADARVLRWAEERTNGVLSAANGRELHLAELRTRGPKAIAEMLHELQAAGRPAALVPDVETAADLALVANGYELALAEGVEVLVRCSPALAGTLAHTTAASPASTRRANRVLVVCGSYVPATTAQLESLIREHPGTLVEVDVKALAATRPEAEVTRVAQAASSLLREGRLAILATARERPPGTESLVAGEKISAGLAHAAGTVSPRPPLVIAKGGVTSCVTLRDGFGVTAADVVGPVVPGVSLWRAGSLDYLVAPGNVGDERLLADVVARVLEE